jgi:repressor LexA
MKRKISQPLEQTNLNAVQKYRKSLNLSQEEVARRIKVRQATVSDWENGIKMPRIGNIRKLASIYMVDAGILAKDFMDIHYKN